MGVEAQKSNVITLRDSPLWRNLCTWAMSHLDENKSGRRGGVRSDTWARAPEMEMLTHPREKTCEGPQKNPGAPPGEQRGRRKLSAPASPGRAAFKSPARVAEHRADRGRDGAWRGRWRHEIKRRRSTWLDRSRTCEKSVSPIAPAWLDRRRWDTRGQSRGFKRHERPAPKRPPYRAAPFDLSCSRRVSRSWPLRGQESRDAGWCVLQGWETSREAPDTQRRQSGRSWQVRL